MIIETVARPCLLTPDHASVVGTYITAEYRYPNRIETAGAQGQTVSFAVVKIK